MAGRWASVWFSGFAVSWGFVFRSASPEGSKASVQVEQIYLNARDITDIGKRCAFIEKAGAGKQELQDAVNHQLSLDNEAEALFGNKTLLAISAENLIETLSGLMEQVAKE